MSADDHTSTTRDFTGAAASVDDLAPREAPGGEIVDGPGEGVHPGGQPGADAHDPAVGHGYIGNKEGYLRRLRRIEGQARGIERMIDEEQYCIDILTQISATTRALQSVALGLLEDHMNHCVVSAARAGTTEAQEKIAEASDAIARLVRS